MRGVLDEIAPAGLERFGIHPHHSGAKSPGDMRRLERRYDHVTAADVDFFGKAESDRLRRGCLSQIAIKRRNTCDARVPPRRQRQHYVALAKNPGSNLPGIAAEIEIRA